MADKKAAGAREVLEEVEKTRRDDPDLERRLERYRADREAYEKVRGTRRESETATTPATGRGSVTGAAPKGAVGRVRHA